MIEVSKQIETKLRMLQLASKLYRLAETERERQQYANDFAQAATWLEDHEVAYRYDKTNSRYVAAEW